MNELWLRALSAIFMSSAIFLGLLLTKKIFRRKIATLAMPFLLFAPFLLRYGFEIRMYGLATFLAVLATFLLICLVEKPSRRNWILYGLVVVAGMLTFNLMVLIFLAHLIYILIKWRESRSSKVLRTALKSYGLALVLYLPWIPFAISQLTGSASSGVENLLGPAQIINIFSFAFLYQPEFWLNPLTALVITIAISLAIYVISIIMRKFSSSERDITKLFLLILVVPIGAIMLLSLILGRQFWLERYILLFIIFGYLILAVACAKSILVSSQRQRLKFIAIYFFFIITLLFGTLNLADIGNYNFQRMEENNAREIATTINCREQTIVKEIQLYFALDYYLPDCTELYFYAPMNTSFDHGYAPIKDSSKLLREIPGGVRVIK